MVPHYPPASHSAITRVFCLSHLISFCHLCNKLFLSHHFLPCSCTFIGLLHFSHHVSLPSFHPSSCHSLNPFSFALLGPHPHRFSSSSPRAVSAAVPFPPTPFRFPSFFLIHFLFASGFIHPPHSYLFLLFTSGFPFAILYLIPMSFVTFPIVTQSFTCAVLLSLFKAQGHKCMHVVVGQYQYFKTHLFQNIKLPHWKMNKAKRMNTDVNVY